MFEKLQFAISVVILVLMIIIVVGQYQIYPKLKLLQTKIELLEGRRLQQESP